MVNRDLDLMHLAITDSNLQNCLEAHNPSYRVLRDVYNQLIQSNINPLKNQGLSADKLTFIMILLEIFLRNSYFICDQNDNLKEKNNYNRTSDVRNKRTKPRTNNPSRK